MENRLIAPQLVKIACYQYEGWITGGATRFISGKSDKPIKDWDILIPSVWWARFCLNIPKNSLTNSFGGIKVEQDGFKMDFWAGDIGWFLGNIPYDMERVAYSPTFQILLEATDKARRF